MVIGFGIEIDIECIRQTLQFEPSNPEFELVINYVSKIFAGHHTITSKILINKPKKILPFAYNVTKAHTIIPLWMYVNWS